MKDDQLNLKQVSNLFLGSRTIICILLVFSFMQASSQKPLSPASKSVKKIATKLSNGMGAFATGNYRNLFKESGHTEKDISVKIDAAFNQLFHGDTATQSIYFADGKNENGALAYISDVLHNDMRSEGMSYGMMICVRLNKKAEFDALWDYSMSRMCEARPEHPPEGYFHWSLKRNGHPMKKPLHLMEKNIS